MGRRSAYFGTRFFMDKWKLFPSNYKRFVTR
jgi:hypothetical protein